MIYLMRLVDQGQRFGHIDMGMWAGIKSILGSGNTVETVAEKAADGLYNGIDKLVYTDEEKAEAFAEARKTYLEFVKVAYDQNSIRSVTRRWLAWSIIGWILINAQVAIVFQILGKADVVKGMLDIANALNIGWAFITILVFYFGVHTLRAVIK